MKTDPAAVSELRHVSKGFPKPSGELLQVLSNIDLQLRNGEILGLLGRSGSGKSTVLRIVAGLIQPTSGEVVYRGAPLTGPSEGIAVVFQTFALFPWLTVFENVEAGLDALGLSREEARQRTSAAIELIGLAGFHSAYPRELSGGMRQRVGFARALATQPNMLLMDEPFSALDVLTAETLRTDFIDLWTSKLLPTKSVLLVTHNIEEAVQMCDRILVLAPNPGRISAEIAITLPQPRDRLDAAFREIVDEIYATLTSRSVASICEHRTGHGGFGQPLPTANVLAIQGMITRLAALGGSADLAALAQKPGLDADKLFPSAEALHILEFAELKQGALELTAAGEAFAAGDTATQKRLFQEHLLRFAPIAGHIHRVLQERAGHLAPRLRFEAELEDHLTRQDANRTLQTIINWGRYAELFDYDDKVRRFKALP